MKRSGVTLIVGLAGCNHWVETQAPLPRVLEEVPPPHLRLATTWGGSVVMVGARLRGDSIAGGIEQQSGREAAMSALLGATIKHRIAGMIAVQDVVRVEARRPDPTATALAVAGIGAGLITAVVVVTQFNNGFKGTANAMIYRFHF